MNDLYHYTSVNSFEGIIKSSSIRMTKSNYLNDPADCNLFVELIEKYMGSSQETLDSALNNSKIANNRGVVEKIYGNDCSLTDYIKYILKHISLYVMSLTEEHDSMYMWNAYGQGGMELKLSIDSLMRAFKTTLTLENEFLTAAHVIYVDRSKDINEIIKGFESLNFSEFTLLDKESDNIFEDHRSFIEEKSNPDAAKLYQTHDLGIFINTYAKSYLLTLDYLVTAGKIDGSTPPETIFENVFNNVSKLYGGMYWKHDISLYMLVLSALIKSNTYEYENEYRIVYFQYDMNQEKTKKEEYFVKHIASGDFVCPYVTFKNETADMLKDSLEEITVSPSTRNLPIDNDIYLSTLKNFILSNGFNLEKEVANSSHKIRW